MKHYFSSLKGDTIKAIFLVCLAVGVVGMSYGSLAMAYGFPLWVPFYPYRTNFHYNERDQLILQVERFVRYKEHGVVNDPAHQYDREKPCA